MKVGIITIHNSPNYGACLQSYALYKYIADRGHDVEIIDLKRPTHADYVPTKRFFRWRANRPSFFRRLKMKLSSILKGKRKDTPKPRYNTLTKETQQKFDDFNSVIKLSQTYNGIDALYANPPHYDLYVTGSDQVWNPTQSYCIEPYFLDFVKNGSKCISYASSIGIAELLPKEKALFKKYLSKYNAISVREKTGKELLDSFLGKDVSLVADPTFLLDREQWLAMASNRGVDDGKYIFMFAISVDEDLINYAIRLSRESGLRLKVIVSTKNKPMPVGDYEDIDDAGVDDFLALIKNAEMVITGSFHCTVFSVIMQSKNFYSYLPSNSPRGSRVKDMLAQLGLSSHILEGDVSQAYTQLQSNTIDFEQVTNAYIAMQNSSRTFLNAHL